MLSALNMKFFGRPNVSKHKDIKGNEKYVTLKTSLKFDSMDKMKISYSESKHKLKRSRKRLITFLSFKAKIGSHKYKKARYATVNVSKKDLSKIIRKFEKIEKLPYDKKRVKT